MQIRPLADRYGRVATDLRVSLTDRCNLRCSYCMPAEGLDWLPDETVLSDDEVVRLIDIGVRLLGVREVRFTGGEPLAVPRLLRQRGLIGGVVPVVGNRVNVELPEHVRRQRIEFDLHVPPVPFNEPLRPRVTRLASVRIDLAR